LASKARLIPLISGLVKTRFELDNLICLDNREKTLGNICISVAETKLQELNIFVGKTEQTQHVSTCISSFYIDVKIWILQVRVKVPGLFPTTLTCHGISKDLTPPIITVVSMRLGVGPKRSFSFGFAKNDFGGCYSTQIFSSNVEKGPISKGKLGGGFKYLLCSSIFGEMIQID